MGKKINILIGGEAGQGIQTIGELLSKVCHNAGLYIFSLNDFESRIRGGHSFNLLRISDEPVTAPEKRIDLLVCMDEATFDVHQEKIGQHTIVLLGSDMQKRAGTGQSAGRIFNIPFDKLALEAGGQIVSNTVAAGTILSIIGAGLKRFAQILEDQFTPKGQKVLDLNLRAAQLGYDQADNIEFPGKIEFNTGRHNHVIISGAQAAALGALAADCRFFPFYPMSPATGVIAAAVSYSDILPIVVEQAEDEIAAVNMAIGASFAGVRALTATSGGGFCLMTEGLGLAAISETPLVIINAQRPGPATGLPTRTAQADLLFSIHASQDEFPRFVFAPGNVMETFNTVKKAFDLADKYQVPAIILLDQFLADSMQTEIDSFEINDSIERYLKKSTDSTAGNAPYLRYELTVDGVSPRALPCQTKDLVRFGGNEHDPQGHNSEDAANRVHMVDKRAAKLSAMISEMEAPSVFSPESDFLLAGWGSLKGSIMEACLELRCQGLDVGWLIFRDIWPMDAQKIKSIIKGKKLIMVEANSTAQLGALISQQTGVRYHSEILQYDGRPVYPEFITRKVKSIMGK